VDLSEVRRQLLVGGASGAVSGGGGVSGHEFCHAEWHRCDGGGPGEYARYVNDGRQAGVEPRRWRTIVVDPPWSYTQHWRRSDQWRSLTGRMFKRGGHNGKYGAGARGAAAQYDCMTLDQIGALPLAEWAEPDAHLYLWTTNAFIRDAFPLVDGWDFTYKTKITWVKRQLGMGLYFRNTTEDVLFAVRGTLKCLRRDVPTHILAPRTRHSAKPDAFYDMVETMSPGPYLDVFARKQRMGWDVAGNEVYSAIPELAAKP
jgi:N6-adenosine-specific RNA methylase IME4